MISDVITELGKLPHWLWQGIGWVFTTILSGWGGYFWGLRSKTQAAKRESRFSALGKIEQSRLQIVACHYFRNIVTPVRDRLQPAVLDFAVRCRCRAKTRIMNAWEEYQKISDWDVDPDNRRFTNQAGASDQARPLLLEPLKRLRDEITDA